MPEEIETARIRRLRDFATERLAHLLAHHAARAKDITHVLDNPGTKEPRYRKWEPMRRERLERILAHHKTMIKAIQLVLEERENT